MSDNKLQDWSSHFGQLARLADKRPMAPHLPKFNPRPAGITRPGSATQAVLALLQAHSGRWFSHFQIVQATGRTSKSVDWALLFLKARGLIESTKDEWRNSRYLKYSIAKGKGAARP